MAQEHDRFLYKKEGILHFGCVNPFCGHGNPALPHHYKVPLDSKDVKIRFISHDNGKLTLEVQPKEAGWKPAISITEDNLEACKEGFDKLKFNPTQEAVEKFKTQSV